MRALALALALALLCGNDAATAEPRDLATRHFRLGSVRYADGSYQAALQEFEAGYAAQPSPAFLVNIGQCLRKLDRLDEAALAFRRFLDTRSGSARTRLDVWDALEDVLAELNRRVDRLAQDAALFRAYLAGSDGDLALRAEVARGLDDIVQELVRIDDTLVGGYGVARGLALPRVQLPARGAAGAPAAADRIRYRLRRWQRRGTPPPRSPTSARPVPPARATSCANVRSAPANLPCYITAACTAPTANTTTSSPPATKRAATTATTRWSTAWRSPPRCPTPTARASSRPAAAPE